MVARSLAPLRRYHRRIARLPALVVVSGDFPVTLAKASAVGAAPIAPLGQRAIYRLAVDNARFLLARETLDLATVAGRIGVDGDVI